VTQAIGSRFHIQNLLPNAERDRRLFLIRLVLGVTFALGALAVIDQRQFADEIAVWAVSPNWRWALRIGGGVVGLVGLIFASTWTTFGNTLSKLSKKFADFTLKLSVVRIFIPVALSAVFPVLVLGSYGRFVLPFFTRLFIFWLLTITATWFVNNLRSSANPIIVSLAVALIFAVVYRIAVFSADVSTYPFSLGWSEASRYYYASLFFARRIYGFSIPPSVLHPTRYLMQSLAFLIPGSNLFFHRLWQVIIWVLLAASIGFVLENRLHLQDGLTRLLFIMWVFLFVFQGPVWYHLLIIVLLLIWGVRRTKPLATLVIVLMASAWAGISRVNWIPVPGMLAALLYLLERRKSDGKLLAFFAWPAIWFFAGTVMGFVSQWLYINLSGNAANQFGSSLSSPLLWYRLYPSATYPLGVLPGIVLASLPMVLIIALRLRENYEHLQPLKLLAILVILLALFGGGILVSVKIGGGSNLHNMDAYLIALMITGVYAVMARWQLHPSDDVGAAPLHGALVIFAIWVPVCFAIGLGKPLRSYDMERAQRALDQVKSIVEPVADGGGEVLLISQRHLITFGNLRTVDVIPEYETVFLMEMAMSRNRDYLDQFQAELKAHEFDMIVVDQLSTQIQGRDHNFAEENNAWVEEVSRPILCHYVLSNRLSTPPLEFYVPRDGENPCDS
jgi:hypothetical protein